MAERVDVDNALRGAALDDGTDPLARGRANFVLADDLVYLDGNSLGPVTRGVADLLDQRVRAEWGSGLIRSWEDAGWWEAPLRVGDRIGRVLLGAAPGQVAVCDSTTINLHKAFAAAMSLAMQDREPGLAEAGAFPSDRYALAASGRAPRLASDDAELGRLLDSGAYAVVVLNHVDYRTGRKLDLGEWTARAHAAGTIVVWDVAHSIGAVSVELDAAGADLAVGCTYKFVNGGPGAPGLIYCAHRHLERVTNPLWGWAGHVDPFAFDDQFRAAAGMRKFLVGTPPMIAFAPLEAALVAFERVRPTELWTRAQDLIDLFIALIDDWTDLEVLTPRDRDRRGSHVSLRHAVPQRVMDLLMERNVIGDVRPPDVLRFGIAPLYLDRLDVVRAVHAIAEVATEVALEGVTEGVTEDAAPGSRRHGTSGVQSV